MRFWVYGLSKASHDIVSTSVMIIHCDIINPRQFEMEASKEMLAELNGIKISEVDNLIQQRIVDFRMMGMGFELYKIVV